MAIPLLLIIGIIVVILIVVFILILMQLYTVVPADEAHVTIREGKKEVFSSNEKYNAEMKAAYFHIPSWFFFFKLGMTVHKIPLKIVAVNVDNFLSFDKDRARFLVNIIAYVVVSDPVQAAQRFSGNLESMKEQISNIVQATTRDATTKKSIREIINNREEIIKEITPALSTAIKNWGIDLKDVELIEFKDPPPNKDGDDESSHVISDISSIIEEQINSDARQKNADQNQKARVAEAQTDETAKKREIQRDEEVGKREQEQKEKVAEAEKLAREKEFEVKRVEAVQRADIDREAAEVLKEKLRLEGEGQKEKLEQLAIGNAAETREEGLADAAAKEALQAALNKFSPGAIQALTAELIVNKDKEVGIATARALQEAADVRVFAGAGEAGKDGFNLGKLISATSLADDGAGMSLINRVGRPNDIGLVSLGVVELQERQRELEVQRKAVKEELVKKKADDKAEKEDAKQQQQQQSRKTEARAKPEKPQQQQRKY